MKICGRQNFGRCCDKYQSIERQSNVVEESLTGIYIKVIVKLMIIPMFEGYTFLDFLLHYLIMLSDDNLKGTIYFLLLELVPGRTFSKFQEIYPQRKSDLAKQRAV